MSRDDLAFAAFALLAGALVLAWVWQLARVTP